MLDIFASDPAFSVVGMTALVNRQPFVPGQIGDLGIFEEDGVTTLTVAIEERHGDLALVEPSPRGGPGETTDNEKRNIKAFSIPHYQRDDSVNADEVQGVRAFGKEGTVDESGRSDQVVTLEDVMATKMRKHTMALDATLEHQRCGALKGLVVDKNGNTLANLYQAYDIPVPAPIEFQLSSATFPVRKTCAAVQQQIEDALDEAFGISGLHALCGPTFWNALIENAEVRSTYLNQVEAAKLRGNAWGNDLFDYGGITFERYRVGRRATASAAPQVGNSPVGFIAPDEVRFIPRLPGLYLTRFAPADYMETVNTKGLPRYAKQWMKLNGKGIDMEVQMNAMSWCTRPEALLGGFAD